MNARKATVSPTPVHLVLKPSGHISHFVLPQLEQSLEFWKMHLGLELAVGVGLGLPLLEAVIEKVTKHKFRNLHNASTCSPVV
jgi:hypothetical protein